MLESTLGLGPALKKLSRVFSWIGFFRFDHLRCYMGSFGKSKLLGLGYIRVVVFDVHSQSHLCLCIAPFDGARLFLPVLFPVVFTTHFHFHYHYRIHNRKKHCSNTILMTDRIRLISAWCAYHLSLSVDGLFRFIKNMNLLCMIRLIMDQSSLAVF